MENNTATQFTNDVAPLPERPQFLKVLCILTWICCGLMLLSALPKLFMHASAEQQEKSIEKIRAMNPEAADKLEAVVSSESDSQRIMMALLNIVSVALSAYGAVMMWQLKKTGFYVYIAGEVLPYFGFLMGGTQAMAAVGSMAGGMGSAIIGVAVTVMVLFDIAFIVMYGVNLKYMKK